MLQNFSVIGGGSWGTAIACLVARVVGSTKIYVIDKESVLDINNNHKNTKYLGDILLPNTISATSDLQEIINSDVIILATPSNAFESVLMQLKENGVKKNRIILIATKGLCENPSMLFSEKMESEFENKYGFFSGPNFAKEVAEDKFTAVTISSKYTDIAKQIADILSTDKLEIDISDDIITVQIASIVKNIAAIKSGINQASGMGENGKAWLVSKALQEIAAISKILGGKIETLANPAIVGDLVLTCYSKTSRNTKFGYEFHKNNYSKDFLENYPILVEGVRSAKLLTKFLQARKINIELPIISSVASLV